MKHLPRIALATPLVLPLGLLACNDATLSAPATGRLTLGISDAPVDRAEHVYVQFRGTELQGAFGQRISIGYVDDSEPPQAITKTLDLTALQGGGYVVCIYSGSGITADDIDGDSGDHCEAD